MTVPTGTSAGLGDDHMMLGLSSLAAITQTEFGMPVERLLDGTAIDPVDLADRDARVRFDDQMIAVRNAIAWTGDARTLGVLVGAGSTLTQVGLFGFAAMAAPTLRDLIAMALRYFSLTSVVVEVGFQLDESRGRVTLSDRHLPPDVRSYFVARDAVGIMTTVEPFLGPTFAEYENRISLSLRPSEADLAPFFEQFPIGAVSVTATTSLVVDFPIEMLDDPLPQADVATVEVCLQQCESLLQREQSRSGVAAHVRRLLLEDTRAPATCDEIAQELGLHPRTLRRRLSAEGTSYRALLSEVRQSIATELLVEVGMPVERVSRRLGYSESAAFIHAFHQWHGMAPGAFVRKQRADSQARGKNHSWSSDSS